jgi:hypothetical protein
LEWQSAQARLRIACTSGEVAIIVSIVWPGENAGLVCAGRQHCTATRPTASSTATHFHFIPFRTSTKRLCSEWQNSSAGTVACAWKERAPLQFARRKHRYFSDNEVVR